MIRKLGEMDRDRLMDYLKPEKEVNLFMIGDLENYGFEKGFQEFWGEFDKEGNLTGVLLRYYSSFILYTRFPCSYEKFSDIIKSYDSVKVISGKQEIIEKLEPHMDLTKIQKRISYLCKLDMLNQSCTPPCSYKILPITPGDIDAVIEMLEDIEEFSNVSANRESFLLEIEKGACRGYIIKDGDKIVSTARTAAENSFSAMVVGVATRKEYRRRGLASACMYRLCRDLLAEGKTPCLFYHNPEAGRIYKRLGFREIGKWVMYIF